VYTLGLDVSLMPVDVVTPGTLRVRSFGKIRIRISDPRSLRSWRTKGTELWFVGSVTMTIGAKSVKTTKTYGKIARGRYKSEKTSNI